MCTVIAPCTQMNHSEYQRVTDVTYHGVTNSTREALKLMESRKTGHIIQIGPALAYRSIPLQSAYCGAKSAIRGISGLKGQPISAGPETCVAVFIEPGASRRNRNRAILFRVLLCKSLLSPPRRLGGFSLKTYASPDVYWQLHISNSYNIFPFSGHYSSKRITSISWCDKSETDAEAVSTAKIAPPLT